ncbi:uncharacterized protein LOC144149728 [Haemaphysalis longicornis]
MAAFSAEADVAVLIEPQVTGSGDNSNSESKRFGHRIGGFVYVNMSRADYEFPVKQRDPYLGRHDLPRFSEDSQGNLVMEPLNTEDLPQAPPPVSRPVWFRLAAAVIGALVMALFTVIGAAIVRAQASAAFLNATGTPEDDTTPRFFFPAYKTENSTTDVSETVKFRNTTTSALTFLPSEPETF